MAFLVQAKISRPLLRTKSTATSSLPSRLAAVYSALFNPHIRCIHCSTRIMAAPVLSTLHHVTGRKLNKLSHQQNTFEVEKKAILDSVASATSPRDKVVALLEGFELHGITPKSSDISIDNLKRFVHQAKHDPSVSSSLLHDWRSKLEHELEVTSTKYEYASLFGKLVVEWIKHPNPASTPKSNAEGNETDGEMSDCFDTVGRKEMYEQRRAWEGYVFVEKKMDCAKIEDYLNSIFGAELPKPKHSPLRILRRSLGRTMNFKSDLDKPEPKEDYEHIDQEEDTKNRFTVGELKSCIKGVLASNFLEGKKRKALADLENQPAVLGELVDVLNMDLDSLEQWEWDPSPIPLQMRRQLNGRYRVYMNEETHQAILLHFIGRSWAVALKQAFSKFYSMEEWNHDPRQRMNKNARQRREYFLNDTANRSTVSTFRRNQFKDKYFLTQLPDTNNDTIREYDQDQCSLDSRSPHATKQSMLRLITTEMLLNTKLYGEFLLVQSDFRYFGPSLPHETIFTVLKFFGVREKWLRFFKKFLEAPLVFAQDGPGAEVQTRKCGVPMSHILSDALSEAVLFCLDIAVYKKTGGANIYRFHDDLWLWGQEKTCQQAWDAVQEFTDITGLKLNKEKTGSALVVADKTLMRRLPSTLPQGKVKWGLLVLDTSAGRWVIDRTQVEVHIKELRRQLSACRSVMAWVQAWNSYVTRFFGANFGLPANCFGRHHNDMIIGTFEYIQRSLFADAGSANVTDHLRGMLKDRFGTDESVPDGFFYFPTELGGLGLRNPLITAFTTYNTKRSTHNPLEPIEKAFEHDQSDYELAKKHWTSSLCNQRHGYKKRINFPNQTPDSDTAPDADEAFMSLEEFTRYREQTSRHLQEAYAELMEPRGEERIPLSIELSSAIPQHNGLKDSAYWRWIFNLYADVIKKKFGGQGLQLGDKDMLPVGSVDLLKSEKVRWEG